MKRIYLSGPITGLPGLNFAAFHSMISSLLHPYSNKEL